MKMAVKGRRVYESNKAGKHMTRLELRDRPGGLSDPEA